MKSISTFFYTIGQGFRNLTRNRWYTLASIATMTACLFLLGMFYSIVANFQNIVKTAEEGVSITVFFNEGTSEDEMTALASQLEKRTEVSKVDYVSAEDAWNSFKDEYLGEYADGFTENPLEDSSNLQIYMKDVSMQPQLVTYIESINIVREVRRSEVTASTLSGMNRFIALVSVCIIAVLLAVSIFLISNTVTIGIAVRKDEIEIAKYIGATDYFVRAPFVIEGVIIGLVGSMIPLALVFYLYTKVVAYVGVHYSLLENILVFLPVQNVFDNLVPLSVGIGVGIGFIGSFVTVHHHLKV
ncbi:permease-like cell division protein FtsX [Butyrivibrio sp. MC2013]|uniref:permease-like cell division protein FtsX n=1 Tax=Butyrivibrio sp. MC2013 TaxID=1280686 RepID=UPI00041C94CF|nr:permease-like cell division protein FtsX [Butyrivibrio sp. MC2013]